MLTVVRIGLGIVGEEATGEVGDGSVGVFEGIKVETVGVGELT